MPPRRKKPRSERRRESSAAHPGEPRREVEALTVGWMLAVLTTLVCQAGSWVAMWLVARDPNATGLALMAWMLSFAAIVVGLLSLLLTVLAVKTRSEPTPKAITVGAVVVGLLPLAVLFLL